MRFYTQAHRYYCGIDLHARWMYVCILDPQGEVLLHRNLRACPETFLKAVEPYRQDLVVAVECIFSWYWLADLCAHHGIEFVLGHALYMKAIHVRKPPLRKIVGLIEGHHTTEALASSRAAYRFRHQPPAAAFGGGSAACPVRWRLGTERLLCGICANAKSYGGLSTTTGLSFVSTKSIVRLVDLSTLTDFLFACWNPNASAKTS